GARDRRGREDEEHDGEHYGREEDPPPADRGGQAADDEPEREAGRSRGAVDDERAVAPRPLGERRRAERHPGRREEPGGHAGDEPRDEEHPALRREPAETREEEEDEEPDDEHPAPPVQVGGPTAEQHEPAVPDDVRRHDPAE